MLKNKTPLLLITAAFMLFISGCATRYKLGENKIQFQEDISVVLQQAQSVYGQSTWGRSLIPPRKHIFVQMTLQLTNTGGTDAVIDLTKIVLLNDENKNKYPVIKIYQVSPVPIGARNNLKLAAGEQVRRILMFIYPQKLRPELLEVNGKKFQIAYQ
jgi:hypothetical protein